MYKILAIFVPAIFLFFQNHHEYSSELLFTSIRAFCISNNAIRFYFYFARNRVRVDPKRQILDSSKQKEFDDDNFKFDENGRKLSIRVEKEKLLVFKSLALQTRKYQGLFWKF